jgi:uncharacterized protein with PQ loop repeat
VSRGKVVSMLLFVFVSGPIWYFLLYSILKAIHPDRLVWFLYIVYVPVGILNSIIGLAAEDKK